MQLVFQIKIKLISVSVKSFWIVSWKTETYTVSLRDSKWRQPFEQYSTYLFGALFHRLRRCSAAELGQVVFLYTYKAGYNITSLFTVQTATIWMLLVLASNTCQTGDSSHVLSTHHVTSCFFSLRLSVGHHQAYHLSWWAQDRSTGWGQHRQHPERSVGGAGVPSQKRADSSVSYSDVLPGIATVCHHTLHSRLGSEAFISAYECAVWTRSHSFNIYYSEMHNWAGLFYIKVPPRNTVNHHHHQGKKPFCIFCPWLCDN